MTITVRLFGFPVVAVSWERPTPDDDDRARDLSGGALSSDRVDVGPTDLFLGFTNGRSTDLSGDPTSGWTR